MNQKGFVAFLLSNPLLMLAAALGIALLATGIALKFANARLERAKEALEAVRAEYAGFRAETERAGREAEARAREKEADYKRVNDEITKQLASSDARLRAALGELRKRPPVRPDGSAVPVAACRPEGADGPPAGEWIPLAEYRALEARAAYDAQTIMLWREWATAQGLAR